MIDHNDKGKEKIRIGDIMNIAPLDFWGEVVRFNHNFVPSPVDCVEPNQPTT